MLLHILLLALASGQIFTQKCCMSKQFEGTFESNGIVGTERTHDLIQVFSNMSYDAEGERIAVTGIRIEDGTQVHSTVIMDFKNGTEYLIIGSKCMKYPSSTFVPFCISNDAKELRQTYLGTPDHNLRVTVYNMLRSNEPITVTVTEDCSFVEWGSIESSKDRSFMSIFRFSDITFGIKDLSVFNPPAICNDGNQIQTDKAPVKMPFHFWKD